MDHQTKVQTIGIVLVNRDNRSMDLVRLAICNWSANSEFRDAIAAGALCMDF